MQDSQHSPSGSRTPAKNSWWKRIGWLVLIWTLSVSALALVTLGLKFLMRAVGFHI